MAEQPALAANASVHIRLTGTRASRALCSLAPVANSRRPMTEYCSSRTRMMVNANHMTTIGGTGIGPV